MCFATGAEPDGGARNEIQADLHRATDAVRGCSGLGGADAVYEITVDAPTRLLCSRAVLGN